MVSEFAVNKKQKAVPVSQVHSSVLVFFVLSV